jgi:hypothetical protein
VGTSGAAQAKAFSGGLVGWEFDDLPTTEQGTYSVGRLRGRAVAGLYHGAEQPAWGSYISVDDVDRATARARELGGGGAGRAVRHAGGWAGGDRPGPGGGGGVAVPAGGALRGRAGERDRDLDLDLADRRRPGRGQGVLRGAVRLGVRGHRRVGPADLLHPGGPAGRGRARARAPGGPDAALDDRVLGGRRRPGRDRGPEARRHGPAAADGRPRWPLHDRRRPRPGAVFTATAVPGGPTRAVDGS